MKAMTTAAQMVLRLAALVAIVLGVLFWTGNALGAPVLLHMGAGILIVLSLWLLALSGARAGVPAGLWTTAVFVGIVVPILGFTQTQLLPGSAHWLVQVLHLLVGLTAIGLGEMLGARIRRAEAAPGT